MTAAAWASPTATWADPLVTWTGDVYAVNATATLAQGTRGRWEGHVVGAPCDVDGCDKPTHARGWCIGHYQRWRKDDEALRLLSSPGTGTVSPTAAGAGGEPEPEALAELVAAEADADAALATLSDRGRR